MENNKKFAKKVKKILDSSLDKHNAILAVMHLLDGYYVVYPTPKNYDKDRDAPEDIAGNLKYDLLNEIRG